MVAAICLFMNYRISMTVHFNNNLCPKLAFCLPVCVAVHCRRIYYVRSLTTLPPFSPSQCCGSATFFSTFTLLPPQEIILKEVCQPTEVAQRDWRDCEPMRGFINIKFDAFFLYSEVRPCDGRDLAEMSASVAGWRGGEGRRRGGEGRRGCRLNCLQSYERAGMMSLAANQKSLQEARGRRHGAFTCCS